MITQNENFGEILPDGIYSTSGNTPENESLDWHVGDMLENHREFSAMLQNKPLDSISLESVLQYKINDYQAYLSATEVLQDCSPITFSQFVLGCQMFKENENQN